MKYRRRRNEIIKNNEALVVLGFGGSYLGAGGMR
jgi:glucose-6-phosphate isomerase